MNKIMLKTLFFTGVLWFFLGGSPNVLAQNTIERQQLFDFDWKFSRGYNNKAETIGFNDEGWQTVHVPHDWSIEGEIDESHPSGDDGGYLPTGTGWYRKEFTVPASWEGKNIGLYFEGVYMDSEVFLNGQSLGVRPYGYSSFYYDLTGHIQYDTTNVVAVRVNNANQKNSRWYSGSGIYRHVWLFVKDPIHISHWGVDITTPEINKETAQVKVRTNVQNNTSEAATLQIETKIFAPDETQVGTAVTEVQINPYSQKDIKQLASVSDPHLWSPESPDLYNASIKIKKGNAITDQLIEPFGIRSIEYSSQNGFMLNGKPVLINGGNVHHDNGALGAKAFDHAEERKIELLKAAGFNAVRTAHNPPSEAFLDACDRVGLLVIDESFDGWRAHKTTYDYSTYFSNWWKDDVTAMVKRDRNHPSIVMWSIGNEIIERTDPEAIQTAKALVETVRELDATRPVTSAMTTWGQGWEIFDPLFAVHDIGGYNYQIHRAESDHERIPSRIILQTESYPKDAFTNWKLVSEHPYIIGDFVWTAIDYLGESGIGRFYYPGETDGEHYEKDHFPWHGAYCGDIDLIGWRKPISHYRSMLYNDDEKLYMAVKEPNPAEGEIGLTVWSVWPTWESWNWPGFEGKPIEVEVYSKYPSVKLFLNDTLIGEKETGEEEEFKAVFEVPFKPGTLRAAGVHHGEEMEAITLRTAGEAAKIGLKPDRTKITSDGQDLSYVLVEITDEEGHIQPNTEIPLTFELEGPGVIEAVDNANLKDTESYYGHTVTTWKGRALVIIRSTRDSGSITLTASSPDFQKSQTVIQSSSE